MTTIGNGGGGVSGAGLTLIEQRILRELTANNNVYFGDNPNVPIEGDCRLIKVNNIVEGQRYEQGAWNTKTIVVSNSMYTDRFVLKGLLRGFLDGSTSLIRPSRLSDTIVVGDASENLRFSGKGTPIYTESLSDTPTQISPQPVGTDQLTTNMLEFYTSPYEYEMVLKIKLYFEASSPSEVYVRWTAHTDLLKTDASLVYESCSLFDYTQAITHNQNKYKVNTTDGMFDFSDKPLYLKDLTPANMYYTLHTSEPATFYGVNVPIGLDTVFFPKFDQWQYKQVKKTIALQEALEHEVKTADFLALNANNYLVDCTGGTVNVSINAETNLFTIGDYENTWNNSEVVNVILGTDTIQLGQQNREKYYIFIRVGTTFRVYSSQGEFKTEGNV